MRKKWTILLAAGLTAAALLAAGLAFFAQPITISDQDEVIEARALALTTGQALYAAGITLDALDRVTPALESPLPFNRQVRIERAVQAYLWSGGQLRAVTGLARTPAELLADAGITLQPGDELWWNGSRLPPNFPLPAGFPLVFHLQQAQPVTVIIDGQPSQISSTGPAVIDALWEAGVRLEPGDWLSVDPGHPLPQDTVVGYKAARPVTVLSEGQPFSFRSAAETVGQALSDAGVSLQNLDYSQPAEDQPLPSDRTIRVVRVREEIHLEETLIPFDSQTAPDPDVELDQRRVTVPGQYGVQVTRERVRYEDGQEISRVVDSDWIASEPVTQTVGYGTQIVPKTLDSPAGPIEYYRAVQVYATSYSPCRLGTGKCSYTTSSGSRLTKGTIAVTLRWYRMLKGHRVYVPGYGLGVIADVGGGIPGRYWIDLGFDEDNYEPMLGWMTLYFLTPAPENVPWVLP
jgi:resuscitation-promoting factor RpfB